MNNDLTIFTDSILDFNTKPKECPKIEKTQHPRRIEIAGRGETAVPLYDHKKPQHQIDAESQLIITRDIQIDYTGTMPEFMHRTQTPADPVLITSVEREQTHPDHPFFKIKYTVFGEDFGLLRQKPVLLPLDVFISQITGEILKTVTDKLTISIRDQLKKHLQKS